MRSRMRLLLLVFVLLYTTQGWAQVPITLTFHTAQSANANGATAPVGNYDDATFTVTGTFTGQVNFQVVTNAGVAVAMQCRQQSSGQLVTTGTVADTYECLIPCSTCTIQAPTSNMTSGSVTVTVTLTFASRQRFGQLLLGTNVKPTNGNCLVGNGTTWGSGSCAATGGGVAPASVALTCDNTTDNLAAINSAISTRTAGTPKTVRLFRNSGTGACMISAPITILSNTTLTVDPYTTIKLVANAFAAGSGSASFAVNSDFTNGNTNIAVIGGIWDGNNLNQPAWVLVANAEITGVGFRFRNMTNLLIRDMTIVETNSIGIHLEQTTNVLVENIDFNFSGTVAQAEVQFEGPATRATVRHLRQLGTASDDSIALEADGGLVQQFQTHGDITDVLIDDIVTPVSVLGVGINGVRFNQDVHNITNVTIRHLRGAFNGGAQGGNAVLFDVPVGPYCPGGLLSSPCTFSASTSGIVLEDIRASACANIISFRHSVAGIDMRNIDDSCGAITYPNSSTSTANRHVQEIVRGAGFAVPNVTNAFTNSLFVDPVVGNGVGLGYDSTGHVGVISSLGNDTGLRFLINAGTTNIGAGHFSKLGYFGIGAYTFTASVPLHIQNDGLLVSGTMRQVAAFQNAAASAGMAFNVDPTGPLGLITCTGASCGVSLLVPNGTKYTVNSAGGFDMGGKITSYNAVAPTNGQLLIGGTAAGTFSAATLTAGSGIAVTNGAASVTVATDATIAKGSSGTPTCGTGCSSITAGSTDLRGSMVSGTTVTSIALNFSATLASAPFCVISTSTTATVAAVNSVTTSALTVITAAAVTGVTIYWHCLL